MEDIIFIVIGLAWFAYSTYKANQKKAMRQSSGVLTTESKSNQSITDTAESEPSHAEELLGQLFSDFTEPGESRKPKGAYNFSDDLNPPEPEADEVEVKPLIERLKVEYESVEYQSPGKTSPALSTENQEDYSRKADESEIFSFNLRQAIIHQAILQRPYS